MNESNYGGSDWVEGELRLSGIDKRMIDLLAAISDTGSITQAAKQCDLSYKGAWQIIERANNCAPNALISTAIGGSKGGGASLTETGKALLGLYVDLHSKHALFLSQLNRSLAEKPEIRLLMQRMAVKTSIRNQLFGTITAINPGMVNDIVEFQLSEETAITVMLNQSEKNALELTTGVDAVLLINSSDIIVAEPDSAQFSDANRLDGTIISLHQDEVNTEVVMLLSNGEILTSLITQHSAHSMRLEKGKKVTAIFKSNTPVLGIR